MSRLAAWEMAVSDVEANSSADIEQEGKKEAEQHDRLKGLGGWLILLGALIIMSLINQMVNFEKVYGPFSINETLGPISDPSNQYYNPLALKFAYIEMAILLAIIVVKFYLIYLFFGKNRLFPKVFIWFTIGSLLYLIISNSVLAFLFPEAIIFDRSFIMAVIFYTSYAAIWVSYMLVSKRVKVTFVND